MLDVPVLLAAVSPDSPCGDDLEYDAAFLELERIAQGQPERQMGDAVLPAEPPEWPRVRALASELFGRSKDLRVANLLLQSNVALDGLDGLTEGLLLVRELRVPRRSPTSRWVPRLSQPSPRRHREPAARSPTAKTSCASSIACSSITFATSRRVRCRCCSSAPRHW